MLASAIGWPGVFLALILAPPAYAAAYNSLRVRHQVDAKNGTTLAATVEETHKHVADATAIVKRTMGERKTDGAKPGGIHTDLERADD